MSAIHHTIANNYKRYDEKVDYIESRLGQYINTLWIPTKTAKISIRMNLLQFSGNPQIGVIEKDENDEKPYYNFHWGYGPNGNVLNFYFGDYDDPQYLFVRNPSTNKVVNLSYDGETGAAVVDGNNYIATIANAVPVNPFYLFARNSNNVAQLFCRMRLYNFKVEDKGLVVLNFNPVRIGDVGAMYDEISKKLFFNDGEDGDFTPGYDT